MARRFLVLLCALFMLALPALAQEGTRYDKPIMGAISNLTEVYGYTLEEAEAFDFTVTETDSQWQVQFSPKEHPEWIYTGAFRKPDGGYISGNSTPFHTNYRKYPGEGGIRDVLNAALQNRWFVEWSEAARSAFVDMMLRMNITPSYALQSGLANKDYPAAQAVEDFFLSCYGDRYGWPPVLYQWRDEVLAKNGLVLEPASSDPASRQGIQTRTMRTGDGTWTYTVTEFLGEIPAELSQAFSHTMLEGWTGLCGALLTFNGSSQASLPADRGMAAFAKGEERLLVALYRKSPSEGWSVAPIGEKALLKNRDFFIACDGHELLFIIEYPISGSESESFECQLVYMGGTGDPQPICRLMAYRRINRETGSGVVIGSGSGWPQGGNYWYITTYQPDHPAQEENVPAFVPEYLEYIDAEQFPKSAESCRQAAAGAFTLPEGYGVVSGVHLRAQTSSHSADLGMYETGALVQVLKTLPGDPSPWYRVRAGQVEGYMSSSYVQYENSADAAGMLFRYVPLRVAKVKQDCALKKGTGWLDGKIIDLSAGTKMHVIATKGDWLHIMIPQGEIGWVMDVNGTDGYVKAAEVVQAATPIRLDWME